MIAHTPTLFGCVALVATIMAFCLILVARFTRRDGVLTTGYGLLAHALAYVCYTLYGHAPLWLTYGAANTLLSVALAFYGVSIFRVREAPVPWRRIFSVPVLMLGCMVLLFDNREHRMLAASLVLSLQCLLIILWARRHAQPAGRAHLLLMIGGVISLVGLLMRVAAVLAGGAAEMQYDVSNLKQTISVSIGTVTVMMYSLGLVLLSKERSEAILEYMARRDGLTGILNRRAILEQLDDALQRARGSAAPLAVAMIDIDHFKRINDVHGHLAGDEVLRHCVRHLQQRLRLHDGLGRYGGEEFLVLLPGMAQADAVQAIETLREVLAQAVVQVGEARIRVSFSAGLWCAVPGPQDTSAGLLALADAALYEAKAGGRNAVRVAHGGGLASHRGPARGVAVGGVSAPP